MLNINLKPKHEQMLKDIFNNYCPHAEIWAYGSRVSGDSHDGSDLDLAVIDFHDAEKRLSELRQILNDSNIPFLIDIFEFHKLPPSFQNEIRKKYIVLYNGNSTD